MDLELASGMVEGAIKHVIGQRFDNGGMRWIRASAPRRYYSSGALRSMAIGTPSSNGYTTSDKPMPSRGVDRVSDVPPRLNCRR